ncbi:MAG: DNA polymerase I [Peptostreptococcaceae bacterium]|nr:DNA polymerase I [Peptostreptococcaceae bacterium]
MNKIVIIDGHSLIYRAFYALPELMTAEGLHTNAIYGFLNMLNRVIEEESPEYISVAFDMKAATFRKEAYEGYKANRKKMPVELREQIPAIKEILDAYRIHRMEFEGYEGDDLIGTLAKECGSQGLKVVIVTGDKDALQLVDENISVMLTKKGISNTKMYDSEAVFDEFGVAPKQIADYKGLVGDKSDNIPGVKGIGKKTAESLLQRFNTVEELYERIDELEKQNLRDKLEAESEEAFLSKRLATIALNVPIDFSIEELALLEPDCERLREYFVKYEFKSLLLKTAKSSKNPDEVEDIETEKVKTEEEISALHKTAAKIGNIGCMAFKNNEVEDKANASYVMFCGEKAYLIDGILSTSNAVRKLLSDENIEKSGYNIKESCLLAKKDGIEMKNIGFDIKIAEHMLHPSGADYSLENIVMSRTGNGLGLSTSKETNNLEYGGRALRAIENLRESMLMELEENGLLHVFKEVEMPLIEVLAEMERNGFYIDTVRLNELDVEFTEKLLSIEQSIYEHAGEEFNINSTKQTGYILFEKLGLPARKKTKTGYSTNQKVLEKIKNKHPIVEEIMEYRQYMKLKSTYVDGLGKLINEETKRLYPSFNQAATVTGRLSTSEPNLQNIPVRLEMGRKLRQIFIAEGERKLVDADYSQIELRVLAHLSKDKGLIEAFNNGIDIHTLTASQVFDVPVEEVTSEQRGRAKGVNFGIIYGISDFGLSDNIGISIKEAASYIDQYFKKYPDVKNFMDNQIDEAKKLGYVRTMFNRKRFIPELKSNNRNLRAFGERTAMNTPIQGSAADIIKIAMIKIYRELKDRELKSKLVLQIHDELIIETEASEIEEIKELMRRNMECAVEMEVPLTVDMKVGESWYETK